MTDRPPTAPPPFDSRSIEDDGDETSPTWDVPEVAATAMLLCVAVLAAGGIVTGIARATTVTGPTFPGSDAQLSWTAVNFGAQWATPVVAALLLAVLGLCWWQFQSWSKVIEAPDPDDDLSVALRHVRRSHLTARCGLIGLGLTALGAIALFASQVGTYAGLPGGDWTIEFSGAANMVAVFALLAAGLWAGRHVGPTLRPVDEPR